MSKRRWTLMIVPDGSGTSRSVRVSERLVRLGVGTLTFFVLATAIISYVAVTKTINMSRLERLERTNYLLAQELDVAEQRLNLLSDTLEYITVLNQRVRNIAGLENTDPEVLQAGIGGPEAPLSTEDAYLQDQALGGRALSVRTDLATLLRRAHILASSFQEAEDSLETYVDRLIRTPSIRPVPREVSWFTSGFNPGREHPIYHTIREHRGIDIAADRGTPILAPADGIVVDVGPRIGYGRMVKIDHGDGVVTTFAHCSRILVRIGQRVTRSQQIALVGSSGTSTGTHLHYEVEVDGENVDPRSFILPEDVVVD